MNDCKKSRSLFDEVFFGELSEAEKRFMDRHLKNCPNCRTELNQNTSLLSGITNKPSGTKTLLVKKSPGAEFWDNYTDKLQQRMISEGILTEKKTEKKTKVKTVLLQITDWLTFPSVPKWAIQGAAAVLLVVMGIFMGRQFFTPLPTQVPGPITRDNSIEQQTFQRIGNFIDRSRVILLAIENFDPETENTQAINLPYQQEISRDLVKRAVALKQDLKGMRQRRLKELIGELEIILLQIANIDSGSEMETIQLVKGGEYLRGMLYKIRINDLRRSTYKINKNRNKKKTI